MDRLAKICKGEDVVETIANLVPVEPEQRGIHAQVFHATVVRLEAGAQFEQCRDSAIDPDRTNAGVLYPGNQLQQGRLAGAVGADQGHRLAAANLEGNVFQHLRAVGAAVSRKQAPHRGQPTSLGRGRREDLADVFNLQQRGSHMKSSKCGLSRR